MKTLILAVWMLTVTSLLAGGKKEQTMVLSFHLQGNQSDGPKMVVPQQVAGQNVYFQVSPVVTHHDVEAFLPFPADDGVSYGVVFQLDKTGAGRLAALTNANRGSLMMARLNGRPLDVVKVNDTVRDGKLVVWQGVTSTEVRMADAMMPRIGQTMKEWKAAKKNK